jgi:hypothetical protein
MPPPKAEAKLCSRRGSASCLAFDSLGELLWRGRKRFLGRRGTRLLRVRRRQGVVRPGIFTRIVEIAPIREGRAGSREDRDGPQEQEKFHAGIESEASDQGKRARRKAIARRPIAREIPFPSGAMD